MDAANYVPMVNPAMIPLPPPTMGRERRGRAKETVLEGEPSSLESPPTLPESPRRLPESSSSPETTEAGPSRRPSRRPPSPPSPRTVVRSLMGADNLKGRERRVSNDIPWKMEKHSGNQTSAEISPTNFLVPSASPEEGLQSTTTPPEAKSPNGGGQQSLVMVEAQQRKSVFSSVPRASLFFKAQTQQREWDQLQREMDLKLGEIAAKRQSPGSVPLPSVRKRGGSEYLAMREEARAKHGHQNSGGEHGPIATMAMRTRRPQAPTASGMGCPAQFVKRSPQGTAPAKTKSAGEVISAFQNSYWEHLQFLKDEVPLIMHNIDAYFGPIANIHKVYTSTTSEKQKVAWVAQNKLDNVFQKPARALEDTFSNLNSQMGVARACQFAVDYGIIPKVVTPAEFRKLAYYASRQATPTTEKVATEMKPQRQTLEEYRRHRENLVKSRRQWLNTWTEEQKLVTCKNVPTPSQLKERKRYRQDRACKLDAHKFAQLLYMCAELGLQRNGYERVYSNYKERVDGFFSMIQITNPLMLDAAICKRTFETQGGALYH